MLFIVTAQIRKVDRSIYGDDKETTFTVTHPVEADSTENAKALLQIRYESKSQMDDPYGLRYYVDDSDVFELINKDNAKLNPYDY